jgi:hypothetical protein
MAGRTIGQKTAFNLPTDQHPDRTLESREFLAGNFQRIITATSTHPLASYLEASLSTVFFWVQQ